MSQVAFNDNNFHDEKLHSAGVVNFSGIGSEAKNANFLNYEELRISDILRSRLDMLIDELDLIGLNSIKVELEKCKTNNIFNYYNIASYLDTFVGFVSRMKKDIKSTSSDVFSNRIRTINEDFYKEFAVQIRRFMEAKNKYEVAKIKGIQVDITAPFMDDDSKRASRKKFLGIF